MLFIFDMGGVVTSTFSADSIFKRLNLSKSEYDKIVKNDFSIYSELEKGKISVEEFWKKFVERAKSLLQEKFQNEENLCALESIVKNDLFRLYFHPVLNEETVKIIKSLRNKHRVVCGTNTIQSHWENHAERGDYSYFDQTYPSNKIGAIKPNHDFFELIMNAENAKASETFFVDDKIENVKAALDVGINAVQFTTAKNLKKAWKK